MRVWESKGMCSSTTWNRSPLEWSYGYVENEESFPEYFMNFYAFPCLILHELSRKLPTAYLYVTTCCGYEDINYLGWSDCT
jgi:hypothetical protein